MNFWNTYDRWSVFIISLLVCTSFCGLYPIYILDEARNAEAAREMLVTSDFIVPYFNGQLRTDKPPLHYFFMVFGYKIFGINALGARFFSGFFGALTFLVTYISTKRHLGKQTAAITFLVLLSSLFFVQQFHQSVPDPYLIFFIATSLFAFYEFHQSSKNIWLLMAYGCIGLGLLTKGPIAIVIPGLVLTAFLILKKEFTLRGIFKFRPVLGLLLALAIAFPWYYAVHEATGGKWTEGFFLDHNVSRFNAGKEGHGGIFLITPLFVILGLLPFSVFIIQGFVRGWKRRRENDFLLFAFLVGTVTLVFFSMASTKLPNYPMPSYPFIGILIAAYLKMVLDDGKKSKAISASLIFMAVLALVLPIGGYLALGLEKQFIHVQNIAWFLLVATIGTALGLYFYYKKNLKKAFLSIAFGWILLGFLLFGAIYPVLTQKSPVAMASNYMDTETKAIVFKRFDSAFPINYHRTFEVFHSMETLERYMAANPDALIITNTRSKEDLELLSKFHLILQQKALFENHTTRIYRLE